MVHNLLKYRSIYFKFLKYHTQTKYYNNIRHNIDFNIKNSTKQKYAANKSDSFYF